jgi:hypothetical protein
VRLDESEQHRAEANLASDVVHHFVMPKRSKPNARIALPRTSL